MQAYSAEWAEYYRRIGKIEEAEAIEKQIAANKVMFCNCWTKHELSLPLLSLFVYQV